MAIVKSKEMIQLMEAEIRAKIKAPHFNKIMLGEVDSLFVYLDAEIAKEASTETRIRGYRVKIEYDSASEGVINQKQESIAKAVYDSLNLKQLF